MSNVPHSTTIALYGQIIIIEKNYLLSKVYTKIYTCCIYKINDNHYFVLFFSRAPLTQAHISCTHVKLLQLSLAWQMNK
jgi:hypothetical protein